MSRGNRLAFLTLGFSGTLAIIGAGFSARVFVGDMEPISKQVDAGINVTKYMEIGVLQMEGEVEAREEVFGDDPNYSQYDYSIVNSPKYETFKQRVEWYTYRKIVFTEGNPDSQALDDGMEFLRFYHDKKMDILTFKNEPTIDGEYLIPDSFVNPDNPEYKNIKFHVGVRPRNIDNKQDPLATGATIDDYIQLNNKYQPKPDLSNSFKLGDQYYTAFENPNNSVLFNFVMTDRVVDVIKVDGTKEPCRVYEFSVNLDQMFWYEEGMKPYDRASVQKLRDAIEQSKNDGTVDENWRIQFEFASCLYQD